MIGLLINYGYKFTLLYLHENGEICLKICHDRISLHMFFNS
jgi:hypothetical protein